MIILTFLIQLMGATMLLLYAVRMVRTGIERSYGASFRRLVTTTGNPLRGALTGVVMAIVLQSSAAVALLVAGFAGAGALTFSTGLAIALGGDLGSALLIQVLSFRLEWLVPLLLAVGGALFTKTEQKRYRQAGRILMGIAFILISLRFLRETMEPIRDSAFLPQVAGYLARDFITAFLVGAALALLMHSSVAVILMCVTLVAMNTLPVAAGVSLVLGANLGSSVIPVWLSRALPAPARRIPLANLILRGTGALIAVVAFARLPILPLIEGFSPGQTLINAHMLFNVVLLSGLLLRFRMEGVMTRLLPDQAVAATDNPLRNTVLTRNVPAKPALALANLRRELLRMIQVTEAMFTPVMDIYAHFDKPQMQALRGQKALLNTALDEVRRYTAAIPQDAMTKAEGKEVRALTEYAIALSLAGDIVARRLLKLAQDKEETAVRFSPEGQSELTSIHEQIVANLGLAANVLISEDLESARLLLGEKTEMTRIERASRLRHLKRLGRGSEVSFASSDIHLETLRALHDFNSQIASVCYPILYRNGQLLETRLIEGTSPAQGTAADDLSNDI